MSIHIMKLQDLTGAKPLKYVDRKLVTGDNVMFCLYNFEPGADFPCHTHEVEQITYMVKGQWFLKVGEKEELASVDTGIVAVFEPNFPFDKEVK